MEQHIIDDTPFDIDNQLTTLLKSTTTYLQKTIQTNYPVPSFDIPSINEENPFLINSKVKQGSLYIALISLLILILLIYILGSWILRMRAESQAKSVSSSGDATKQMDNSQSGINNNNNNSNNNNTVTNSSTTINKIQRSNQITQTPLAGPLGFGRPTTLREIHENRTGFNSSTNDTSSLHGSLIYGDQSSRPSSRPSSRRSYYRAQSNGSSVLQLDQSLLSKSSSMKITTKMNTNNTINYTSDSNDGETSYYSVLQEPEKVASRPRSRSRSSIFEGGELPYLPAPMIRKEFPINHPYAQITINNESDLSLNNGPKQPSPPQKEKRISKSTPKANSLSSKHKLESHQSYNQGSSKSQNKPKRLRSPVIRIAKGSKSKSPTIVSLKNQITNKSTSNMSSRKQFPSKSLARTPSPLKSTFNPKSSDKATPMISCEKSHSTPCLISDRDAANKDDDNIRRKLSTRLQGYAVYDSLKSINRLADRSVEDSDVEAYAE